MKKILKLMSLMILAIASLNLAANEQAPTKTITVEVNHIALNAYGRVIPWSSRQSESKIISFASEEEIDSYIDTLAQFASSICHINTTRRVSFGLFQTSTHLEENRSILKNAPSEGLHILFLVTRWNEDFVNAAFKR